MATFKYRDPQTGQYKSDIHVVGAVSSVNGKNGVVELNAEDVGAMEYYILTYDGSHFFHDGEQLTFTQIKNACLDDHHFVYAQYDGDLYIQQHIQGALIFFDATYIRNGKAEIHRISITPAGTGTEVIYVADSTDLESKQDVIDDLDEIRANAESVSEVVEVSDTQPTTEATEIWIDPTGEDSTATGEDIIVSEADQRSISSALDSKITAPANPSVGKVFRVKSVNSDGSFVDEWADESAGQLIENMIAYGYSWNQQYWPGDFCVYEGQLWRCFKDTPVGPFDETSWYPLYVTTTIREVETLAKNAINGLSGKVDDVQVNGASVVENGTANVPLMSTSTVGVAKCGLGLKMQDLTLRMDTATTANIASRVQGKVLAANLINDFVKGAFTDSNKMVLSGTEKASACETIGASFDGYELIEEFEFDATRLTERRAEPDGTPYHFKHLFVEMYTAAGTKNTVSTFRAGHTSYSNCCRANIPYGFDTIARYSCVWVDYVNGLYRIRHSSGIGSSTQASYGTLYNNIPFETDRDIQYIRLSEEASAASSGNIMRIWAVRS